jgi:DNA-directed RNA polymerase specialized sigma24 family protein
MMELIWQNAQSGTGKLNMQAIQDSQLSSFNTLALRYQDEAYTLAYYLSGDEARATEATQAAFASLYLRQGLRLEQFRQEVLHWVLVNCRQFGASFPGRSPSRAMAKDDLCRQLLGLPEKDRSAVILVDILGLNYSEAAFVLDCSPRQAGRWVAQGRILLSQQAGHAH